MTPDPSLLQFLALGWGAVASVVAVRSDLRWRRIPNRWVVPACGGVTLLLGLSALRGAPASFALLVTALGAGAGLAGAHLALALLGGLGGGDVKLALLLGTLLGHTGGWAAAGWGAALAWVGAGAAVLARRWGRRARDPDPPAPAAPIALTAPAPLPAPTAFPGLPFAPFLVVGGWSVIVLALVVRGPG